MNRLLGYACNRTYLFERASPNPIDLHLVRLLLYLFLFDKSKDNFVQGQKDKMLTMRATTTCMLDEDFDFDAEDAADDEGDEEEAAVESAAAKRRRLSGPPETLAEVARLQARLANVISATEAVEASVFCAEQRLAALQAENRALWGHFADAAAAVSGGECNAMAGGFNAAAALQGITAAIADAEANEAAAAAAEAAANAMAASETATVATEPDAALNNANSNSEASIRNGAMPPESPTTLHV